MIGDGVGRIMAQHHEYPGKKLPEVGLLVTPLSAEWSAMESRLPWGTTQDLSSKTHPGLLWCGPGNSRDLPL